MVPDAALIDRFDKDLSALVGAGTRLGIAVSGGPDSLALLLLAAAARRGKVEAATVDHDLRAGSREEAETVAALCERLGVPHRIFTVDWPRKPTTAIQEQARAARYKLLNRWAQNHGLDAIATAHHLDDQVETFIMRLNRGAGVRGLAGMRRVGVTPGGKTTLVRPLLGWRRSELAAVCADAEVQAAIDPSNSDDQFERARIRQALEGAEWLDRAGVASSAAHLRQAHAALNWASAREWDHSVFEDGDEILYRPGNAPSEIRRRIVARVIARLATEGRDAELRGRELDNLLAVLRSGGTATIRGVQCTGGLDWRFSRAPARRH